MTTTADDPALSTLSTLASRCADGGDPDALVADALPLVLELIGARSLVVVRRHDGGYETVAAAGEELAVDRLDEAVLDAAGAAPTSATGSTEVTRLPELLGVLVVVERAPAEERPWGEVALTLLREALGRLAAEARFQDLQLRVDNAQQLANMGDYDWHIPTDTNRWSDQLYRIYGHAPQSFNASYERFLSLIHPEDRERITGVHQRAYATGEPYQMIERIVRPDGEVRYLSSNGQVIMDEGGTPVRMRGTCIDITDRVLAEDERERSAARFRALVESSPDAIMVLDGEQRVLQANGRAGDLLGGDPVGRAFTDLVPSGVQAHAVGVEALGLDGRKLTLDLTSAHLVKADDEAVLAVFVHDASPRLASESMAASLREAQVRRRQALEINDNVVQGLTAAVYALEQGNVGASSTFLQRTLASARRMMNDLLDPLNGDDLQAGDLLRAEPAVLDESRPVAEVAEVDEAGREPAEEPAVRHRVLVVDDSEDVRLLLTLRLATVPGCEVVGESEDGVQAVEMARELQPDLVLLDLAMPRMDGLQALPMLREAVEGVRVVVLSGFDRGAMEEKALAAGADCYVEKGTALNEIAQVIEGVLQPS